jgi:hypothetical protein
MKKNILRCVTFFIALVLTFTVSAIEVQIFHTNFSDLQEVSQSSGSTPVVSTDGSFQVVRGSTNQNSSAISWANNATSYFVTSASSGLITFNNLQLFNGGRIVIKWGSASGRPLNVGTGTTFEANDIGTHPTLTSSERSTLVTENFTISSSITGNTSITISSSSGSGVYVFEVTVYTNSQGPIIDSFTLAGASGTITNTSSVAGTITVTVPYATNLTSLTPTITLASGTSFVDPISAGAPKDFSSPVNYVVTDGAETRTYAVTVSKEAPSTACNILTFTVPNQVGNTVIGTNTIAITVPYSTTDATLSALVPTYTVSPLVSTTTPNSGVANDFTSPVIYTIVAEDGTTQKQYTVTVSRAPASTACNITALSLGVVNENVSISQASGAITVTVPGAQNITSIIPSITISQSATITAPASLSTTPFTATDFTNPVNITVLAEDGVTQKEYTVTVTKDGTSPVLVSSNPSDGNQTASLAGLITLTYDENIKIGSGTITLNGGTLGAPTISGATVKIPFSGLVGLTDYTLTIPAGMFTDMYGNPCVADIISFRTADGVNNIFPYASYMDGANFALPAFITGGAYDVTADTKASTTTQYGAYKLAPGEKLTITSSKVGTVQATFYAMGGNRSFTISNNSNVDVKYGYLNDYDNYGTLYNPIFQTIDSSVETEVYLTNTSVSGDIYIGYIYISDVGQPALNEKDVWCK